MLTRKQADKRAGHQAAPSPSPHPRLAILPACQLVACQPVILVSNYPHDHRHLDRRFRGITPTVEPFGIGTLCRLRNRLSGQHTEDDRNIGV
jgi:hypothetical protein